MEKAMTKMSLAFVVASLCSLAACGSKPGAPDLTGKYTEFKDAMCKCKAGDSACAQKVLDDQKMWSEQLAAKADKNAKVVEPAEAAAAAKKLEPIMAEMTKCTTAAMTPAVGGGSGEKPAEPTKAGSGEKPVEPTAGGSGSGDAKADGAKKE